MKITLCSLGIFFGVGSALGQTLFEQNFSSGSTLSTYFNASNPTAAQFNGIAVTGSSTTVSINNEALMFARNNGNAGYFVRSTDFSPVPQVVLLKFDLNISGNSSAATNVAVFQVGSGFSVNSNTEANAAVHSRLAINFTATSGTFTLRDIGGSANSSNLSGTQTIRWYINNSGSTMNYTGPDLTVYSLANDTAQVWAGTSRVFTSIGATTATQTMSDMKFVFSAGTGNITLDDFSVTAIPEPSSFAAFAALGMLGFCATRRRR